MSLFNYILIFAVFYLLYRFFSRNQPVVIDELDAVMKNDEYKVKGRFE